ncbi:hypothetical protein BK666_19005 [Pseudomonas frederiksbergensis]|uniref:Uncharacterized protein n=1 Tax=Pseudomonas frederiksbergensis TaxID=104087 RepID=A0A423JZ11_9PSED|nr:hypothetical protein [Pseudomonas frederiksbergensis]RON43189.1 hypothetical protein BK666_19005 [Pseudomonas frederiksbergensis]
MIKKHTAVLISIGEIVEEEVVLLIGDVKVRCFASYCPRKIEVGESYEVELEMVLPENDFIVITQEKNTAIEMIGDGFACILNGFLDGSVFHSFVDFADLEIHYDYPKLNEKYIKIMVDRIDASFD